MKPKGDPRQDASRVLYFLPISKIPITHLQSSLLARNAAHQFHGRVRRPIRALVPVSAVSVLMHRPNASNLLYFYPWPVSAHRSESDAVPDHAQGLDALAARQRGTQLDAALHDADGEIGIGLGVPVVLLKRAAKYAAAACG
jgi:hypothetical protein